MIRRPKSIPKGRWSALWDAGVHRLGADAPLDRLVLLERMVLNLMVADERLAEARVNPVVTGSTGQEVSHPGFAVAARCDQVALSLARQLSVEVPDASSRSKPKPADPFAEADELAAKRAAKSA